MDNELLLSRSRLKERIEELEDELEVMKERLEEVEHQLCLQDPILHTDPDMRQPLPQKSSLSPVRNNSSSNLKRSESNSSTGNDDQFFKLTNHYYDVHGFLFEGKDLIFPPESETKSDCDDPSASLEC